MEIGMGSRFVRLKMEFLADYMRLSGATVEGTRLFNAI
jgi:hypothetical protein